MFLDYYVIPLDSLENFLQSHEQQVLLFIYDTLEGERLVFKTVSLF